MKRNFQKSENGNNLYFMIVLWGVTLFINVSFFNNAFF